MGAVVDHLARAATERIEEYGERHRNGDSQNNIFCAKIMKFWHV
jgi:hypothetical protein